MILYFIVITLIIATEIDVTQKCECENLQLQAECNQHSHCSWDSDSQICISEEYCTASLSLQCTENTLCAFVNNQCQYFTKCKDYQGSKQDCEEISLLCTSIDGVNCSDIPQQICSNFNEEDCNSSYGSEGECVWKNSLCQIALSCNDIGSDIIKCYYNYHSCKPSGGTCIDKECSNFQQADECTAVLVYDPQDDPKQVKICKWENGSCIDAALEDIDQNRCNDNLQNSYHWIDNSCQQCTPSLLSQVISVAIILVILQ